MDNYKVKICLVCGKEYKPSGTNQKFCIKCGPEVRAVQKTMPLTTQAKEKQKEYDHNRYLTHHKEKKIRDDKWKHNNPEKVAAYQRKNAFGISQEEYTTLLLSQGGKCAICGKENSGSIRNGKYRRMFVDHNHTTGKVRGLLCSKCNFAIGWLETIARRDEERLLRDYLYKYK